MRCPGVRRSSASSAAQQARHRRTAQKESQPQRQLPKHLPRSQKAFFLPCLPCLPALPAARLGEADAEALPHKLDCRRGATSARRQVCWSRAAGELTTRRVQWRPQHGVASKGMPRMPGRGACARVCTAGTGGLGELQVCGDGEVRLECAPGAQDLLWLWDGRAEPRICCAPTCVPARQVEVEACECRISVECRAAR